MSCNDRKRQHDRGKPWRLMKSRFISNAYEKPSRDRPLSSIRIRAAAGNPRRGWLTAGGRTDPRGAGTGRHPGQQARGRRRHAERHFPPAQIMVARRPPPAAAHLSAGPRHQPEDAWCEDPNDRHYNRPVRLERDRSGDRLAARGPSLRFHRRDRSQHRARASPAAAARYSCIWRATISRRPPAASR